MRRYVSFAGSRCPQAGLSQGEAEGGIGRRPHARPEAALPSAKPAALTQYRNSSPIAITAITAIPTITAG